MSQTKPKLTLKAKPKPKAGPKPKITLKSKPKPKPETKKASPQKPKITVKTETKKASPKPKPKIAVKTETKKASPKPKTDSLQRDFEELLVSHLENEQIRVSVKGDPEAHELEFRLGNYDIKKRRFRPDINILDFGRIYSTYAQKYPNFSRSVQLDIIYDQNYRVTVSGATPENSKNEVEYFCSTNHLKENATYQEKTQILKTDNHEYSYRLSSSKETDLTMKKQPDLVKNIKEKVENHTISKYYRYKNRCSFLLADGKVRLDLTEYKESPDTAGTFLNSFTLDQKSKYMVELEYVDKDFGVDTLTKVIYPEFKQLLAVYQNATQPMSRSQADEVILEYLRMVTNDEKFELSGHQLRDFSVSKFMALEVIPLTRQNFDTALENTLVSVKADGEHKLLFGHPKFPGQFFLINNRLQVSPLELLEAPRVLENSGPIILDGEYVHQYQGKNRFLIFDCFFYQGKDVRHHPLMIKQVLRDPKQRGRKKTKYLTTDTTRFHYVKEFQKLIKNDAMQNDTIVQLKDYYHLTDPKFKGLFKSDLTDLNEKLFPYPTDGLINTPFNQPYPKIVWHRPNRFKKPSFVFDQDLQPITKWKPPQYLSVDFRVNFYPYGNQKRIIRIDDEDYLEVRLESSYSGKILDFEPVAYRVKNYKIAYLKLDGQKKPKMVKHFMIGEQKHEIDAHSIDYVVKNRDILEFIWIPNSDRERFPDMWGHWFPIKYREDKTQMGYPNSFKVASDTWVMINDLQITPPMLLGISQVNPQLQLTYYQGTEDRKTSLDLRNVHNSIKSLLLFLASYNSSRSTSLMDWASGRLGDLGKYKVGFKNVLAIEYDEGNLKAGPQSAFGRYFKYLSDFYRNASKYPKSSRGQFSQPLKVDLIQGNMGLKIDDPNFSREEVFNYLIQHRTRQKEQYGVVSCQFAIHYICDTEEHLNNFFQNVSENLSPGGIFIATTFDGEKIFQSLRRTKDGILKGTDSNQKLLWQIERKFDAKESFQNFGQRISVTNATISPDPYIEFLVNFKYLTKVAEKHGLIPNQLAYQGQVVPLDGSYGTQEFGVLYDDPYFDLIKKTGIYSDSLLKRLENSVRTIDPSLRKYSEFSSFLILKKVN